MNGTVEYEKALANPAEAFATPDDVVKAPGLNKDQKVEILRRWQYDASEEDVAADEGMSGSAQLSGEGEASVLQSVGRALERLLGGETAKQPSPNKQHGV
ncbi:MAG: hypothetical protein GEU92_19600 [Alphaproteobacteria bacterium]|nr:hypothetical protein [Alphaproteobacteria bacterium]